MCFTILSACKSANLKIHGQQQQKWESSSPHLYINHGKTIRDKFEITNAGSLLWVVGLKIYAALQLMRLVWTKQSPEISVQFKHSPSMTSSSSLGWSQPSLHLFCSPSNLFYMLHIFSRGHIIPAGAGWFASSPCFHTGNTVQRKEGSISFHRLFVCGSYRPHHVSTVQYLLLLI